MTTFYIYEVPGIKNGATKHWETRRAYNFNRHQIEPIIIETIEGPNTIETWQVVGDREWYYADLNGYDRGTHYVQVILRASKGGQKGCLVTPVQMFTTTESRAKGGRNSKANKLTPEQELEVVNKYIPRKYSQYRLAKEYGVSQPCINYIIKTNTP